MIPGFPSFERCVEASAKLLMEGKYPEGEELICVKAGQSFDLKAMPSALHDRRCLDLNACLFELGERHPYYDRLADEFDPQGLSCPGH